MKYYLILIAFLVVFAGCSPSLITCNNYDVSDAENRHVLILAPMDNSVYIQNASDVLDDFPNDKREPSVVIRSQICQMSDWVIRHAKKANGNDIFSSDSLIAISTLDMDNTFIREARIGEDTALTTFYLPTKEWLIKKGINPDIVALLNSVSYSRGATCTSGAGYYMPGHTISTPGGSFSTGGMFVGGGGYSNNLFADVKFILYDYKYDNWITCGKPIITTSIILALTKNGWEESFDKIIKAMFEKSPWEKAIKPNIR